LVLCYCCLDNTVNLIPICCFNTKSLTRSMLLKVLHRTIMAPGSLDPPSTIKLSSVITLGCSNGMQCVGPHRQDDAEASSSPPCCPSSFNNQTTSASLLAVYSMQYSAPIGKTISMHLHHHHQLAARHRSPPSS
jgi:hypothetical protein